MQITRQWITRYTDDSRREIIERIWLPSEDNNHLWSDGEVLDPDHWVVTGENEGVHHQDCFAVTSSVSPR